MTSEVVKRFAEKIPKQTEFGNLRLEIRDQAVCVNGSSEWTHVTAQGFQVLWYLAKAQGGIVHTKDLADWLNENSPLENGKSPNYTAVVRTVINILKEKMNSLDSLRVRIVSDGPKTGYHLEIF